MELRDAVRSRRMVRRYTSEPVPERVLMAVLDLARRAPSAGNTQAVEFVVVTRDDLRGDLALLCDEESFAARGLPRWLGSAPVHVVLCTSPDAYRRRYAEADKAKSAGPDAWAVPFWWIDAGAALMTLLLAAVDAGLGAGFLDLRDRGGVRALLGIPEAVEPVGLVTLGYDAGDAPVGSALRPRRPLAEVMHPESW